MPKGVYTRIPRPLCERFFEKVAEPDASGCWLWTAAMDSHGYGQIYGDGRTESAHRVSWELYRGPVPDGLCVLHNCPGGDNPACVNPAHLWLGTQVENIADRDAKGRGVAPPVIRGARSRFAKLSADDVREIRRRWPGETQTALGRAFGVGQAAISLIVRRVNWQHISDD